VNARTIEQEAKQEGSVLVRAFRPFLRRHGRRCVALKTVITSVFLGSVTLDHIFGIHLVLAANVIWLWVDFE